LSEGLRSKGKGRKESYHDLIQCARRCRIELNLRQEDVVEVVDGKKERRGGRRGRFLKYFLGREGPLRGEARRDTGSRDSWRFTVTKKVRAFKKLGGSEGSVQRCERRQSLKAICMSQILCKTMNSYS
jgi:hypothetical protein